MVFGKELGSFITFGTAAVKCPNGRPRVERSLQEATRLDLTEFKEELRRQVAVDKNKAVLVYVHG